MNDESKDARLDRFCANLAGVDSELIKEGLASSIPSSPDQYTSLLDLWNASVSEGDDEMLVVRNTFLELCQLAVSPDRFMSAPATFPGNVTPPPSSTIMIRNIPTRISAEVFLEVCKLGETNCIDFFYLPIDFKTSKNLGYCFVNFTSDRLAKEFMQEYNEKKYVFCATSEKQLAISFSNRQGYVANLEVFTATKLLDTWPIAYRPLALHEGHLVPIDSELLTKILLVS